MHRREASGMDPPFLEVTGAGILTVHPLLPQVDKERCVLPV